MKELRINWDKGEVRHKGVDIDLSELKEKVGQISPELVNYYRFSPRFNKKNGNITYKYAWDSIFFDFHKSFNLRNLLDIIVKEKTCQRRKRKTGSV